MMPLRCYPSHDETEKVYQVSGAQKDDKWKAFFVSFSHITVQWHGLRNKKNLANNQSGHNVQRKLTLACSSWQFSTGTNSKKAADSTGRYIGSSFGHKLTPRTDSELTYKGEYIGTSPVYFSRSLLSLHTTLVALNNEGRNNIGKYKFP